MRDEKKIMYDELRTRTEDSVYFILTDFTGLTVDKDQELRGQLREVSAEFHVVKNSLLRSVSKDIGMEKLGDGLEGQTAMIHGAGEITDALKIVQAFVKEHSIPVMKVGSLNGVFLTSDDLKTIADLPSRDELIAKVVGTIAAPLSGTVVVLNKLVGGLVHVLKAIENNKERAA